MTDNLPANLMDLAKGLQQSASTASGGGSGLYMKFAKGDWTYGQEETDVEADSEWVVNPHGFKHGWVGWGDKAHNTAGTKLGEQMVPANNPLPLQGALDDIQGEWSQQVSMEMLCVSGSDQGTAVIFNTSSVGGRTLYQKLLTGRFTRPYSSSWSG